MRYTFMIGVTRYCGTDGNLLLSLADSNRVNNCQTNGKAKQSDKETIKGGRHEIPLGDKEW
jgi:DNA-directed RNA polymerase subunit M/transcription elongation factor TFIIS